MREWWANVYARDGKQDRHKFQHADRQEAEWGANMGNGDRSPYLNSRIHVRLKPEGAPRRYASERERMWWESDPEAMREVSEKLADYMREARARWAPLRVGIGGTG